MPDASDEPPYRILPLGSHHDRTGFSCGREKLDAYLQKQARSEAKRRIAAPFVLTAGDESKVIGYYTLSTTGIMLEDLPPEVAQKLPRYPVVPATLLGRLAVDSGYHGRGLGEFLLMDALFRTWRHAEEIAAFAVLVDAIDENAAKFYARYEFQSFPDQANRLFLPMKKIAQLFSK